MRPSSALFASTASFLLLCACGSTDLALLPDDGGSDASSDGSLRGDSAPQSDAATADATTTDAPAEASGEAGVGGCSTSKGSGNFPSFHDACTSDHDCVLVLHQLDCCGSFAAIGINVDARNDFDADENIWRGTCPACGCAASPTVAQDGNTGSITSMRVTCAGASAGSGLCRTYVQM